MEKKIGVEIEFTGVRRSEVVTALENLFQCVSESIKSKTAEDGYFYNRIKDSNGDFWLVVRDRSIKPQAYAYKCYDTDEVNKFSVIDLDDYESTDYMVELVSPALTSKSLPTLFAVVDVIKSLGGIVNSSCGIHVHIDRPSSDKDIINLYRRFCSEQSSIFNYFNVEKWRLLKYCKMYDSSLEVPDFDNLDTFMLWLWGNYRDLNKDRDSLPQQSRSLRYYGLNFYSIFQHNTIEFRLFNSSLNRVDIAKIIDWVIHFVYTSDDYNLYIPVLGGILANELKED